MISLETVPSETGGDSIVWIYAARMQIEETFRDTKSPRFGWGLEYSKTRSTRRFDVLLMLAALAFAAVVLVGAAARELGSEPQLRARSGANRVVLSVFTLGALIANSVRRIAIRFHVIWRQLKRRERSNARSFPRMPPPRSRGRTSRYLPRTVCSAQTVAGKAGDGHGRVKFEGNLSVAA